MKWNASSLRIFDFLNYYSEFVTDPHLFEQFFETATPDPLNRGLKCEKIVWEILKL